MQFTLKPVVGKVEGQKYLRAKIIGKAIHKNKNFCKLECFCTIFFEKYILCRLSQKRINFQR